MSVSEIAGALKRTVEGAFSRVRVRGEISGWKRAASGHCYFSLKDEGAVLDAILWKNAAQRLAFSPEDGAEVIATGKLTTYPGRSKYQISVESLELAGEGALMALLDKRRRALAAEGLFASERKKPLPYIPRVIGVVTSPTGAVIRDILHRLEDRFPTHVILWPVAVQGEGAAAKIAAAIRGFDALREGGPVPRPDLVIVARGGGSIEDLWAFNEEVVVRAAADCSIPLISAVGHETDTTLIDHAADKRAPTPTAAAEMAVPVRRELVAYVADQGRRAGDALARQLDRIGERVRTANERFPEAGALLAIPEQRFDEAVRRLGQGLRQQANDAAGRYAAWAGRLDPARLFDRRLEDARDRVARAGGSLARSLAVRADRAADRLSAQSMRLVPALAAREAEARSALGAWSGRLDGERLVARRIDEGERRLAAAARALDLVHPERPLKLGFARVIGPDGEATITSAADARAASRLTLRFADGDAPVVPEGKDSPPPPKPKVAPRRASPYRAGQPGLFDEPGKED